MTELSRVCILVVENDVLTRNLISTILNNEGHFVLAAANNAEGLEISRTFLGEIRLLIAKSAEVAGTIVRERPETRVILLSGLMSAELKGIAQTVHPAAFLQHAALPQRLRDLTERALTDPNFGSAFVEV
jgi:CheY-like chemotaxis protein